MSNKATEMLVSACIRFLQAYPPFDRMEADALRFLAEQVRLVHYPKGARILSSEMGVARALYIVHRGTVRREGERRAKQRRVFSGDPGPGSGVCHRGADGAAPDIQFLRRP
jgi:CBS domain-containing protein